MALVEVVLEKSCFRGEDRQNELLIASPNSSHCHW